MFGVIKEGIGNWVFVGVFYLVGGKIGMVQVYLLKGSEYKEFVVKKYLWDYVLFIVYVLIDKLMIVFVVLVENGGFGVQLVVLIVCMVFDYYLFGKLLVGVVFEDVEVFEEDFVEE